MKSKIEMAHEWFMKHGRESCYTTTDIASAWKYADAMQAEADKRSVSGLPEALQDDFEVDWRVAPGWAKYWVMDYDCHAYWLDGKPKLSVTWLNNCAWVEAPSFNYKGDWKESLRIKP